MPSYAYNAPMLGQFVLLIEGPILISEEDNSTLGNVSLLVDSWLRNPPRRREAPIHPFARCSAD